jgi:hypothetical protein
MDDNELIVIAIAILVIGFGISIPIVRRWYSTKNW